MNDSHSLSEDFLFRSIRKDEAEEAADIEEICFSPEEACTRKMMRERIEAAPELFLVAIDRQTGKMAAFLCGLATSETAFRDEFFWEPSLYEPEGENVILLGLDVLPEYRHMGLGREMVRRYAEAEKAKGRRSLILTTHEDKVGMYQKFGFQDVGLSASLWGGSHWHEMVLFLKSLQTRAFPRDVSEEKTSL